MDVNGAERADHAGEQRAAQQREYDHRLARRHRQSLDQDIDPDVNPGANPERSAKFRQTNM